MDFGASDNANIQASTRELFLSSVVPAVVMKMPLLARVYLARQMSFRGGKYITRPVDKAEMDDLHQSYFPTDRLTVGKKSMLETPYFHWKYMQVPVSYDVEEYLQNSGGGDLAPVDLIKFLTRKAQRACRIALYKQLYGIGTSTVVDSDHDREFQSLVEALTHNGTYGHLTRATTTTNPWWQGGSIAETWADQATSYAPSISTFRRQVDAVSIYEPDQPGSYLYVCGPAIFRSLQSQVEARHSYGRVGGTLLAKYGFTTLEIDGLEVVLDPFLRNSIATNAHKWTFLLHVPDFELRLHPRRAFEFTGMTWQGDRADGYDEWAGRIMLAGNSILWDPNKSIYNSNVA